MHNVCVQHLDVRWTDVGVLTHFKNPPSIEAIVLTVNILQNERLFCEITVYKILPCNVYLHYYRDLKGFKRPNAPPPPLKSPSQLTFLFKLNATINYHDSQ